MISVFLCTRPGYVGGGVPYIHGDDGVATEYAPAPPLLGLDASHGSS